MNLTQEAQKRSEEAQAKADVTQEVVTNSTRQRRRTEALVNRTEDQFSHGNRDNEETLEDLSGRLDGLNAEIPDLNEQVKTGLFGFVFELDKVSNIGGVLNNL